MSQREEHHSLTGPALVAALEATVTPGSLIPTFPASTTLRDLVTALAVAAVCRRERLAMPTEDIVQSVLPWVKRCSEKKPASAEAWNATVAELAAPSCNAFVSVLFDLLICRHFYVRECCVHVPVIISLLRCAAPPHARSDFGLLSATAYRALAFAQYEREAYLKSKTCKHFIAAFLACNQYQYAYTSWLSYALLKQDQGTSKTPTVFATKVVPKTVRSIRAFDGLVAESLALLASLQTSARPAVAASAPLPEANEEVLLGTTAAAAATETEPAAEPATEPAASATTNKDESAPPASTEQTTAAGSVWNLFGWFA